MITKRVEDHWPAIRHWVVASIAFVGELLVLVFDIWMMTVQNLLHNFEERDWESPTEETVRFALIGVGWWTVEQALPAIEESDYCETTVLVSSSPDKANSVAREVSSDTRGITYEEFHEGVASNAYDAVYICTPNAFHLDYAESAARLGKHVLCEKPMEATVERAREMVQICETNDVRLTIGYRMQTEPAIRRTRELIRDGAIGTPRYVHGTNTQRLFDINDSHDQWRLNPELSGYGTSVMDLGIYPINTTRFLLDTDPVTVQGTMRSDQDGFSEVPDEHSAFILEYENGVYAVCTASQNAHSNTFLEITGTEGVMRIDPAFHMETELSITVGENRVSFDTSTVDQMRELFDYFAHAVITETAVTADGKHGLVDIETIQAIHHAAEASERIKLDE